MKKITPAMASAWLAKNKRNRKIAKRRVESYAREMANGNWMEHHQGIAFYEDGTLADGQHRLAAVVQAGVPVPMMVTRGVPEVSGLMIDGHQRRELHQSIKISGLADWIGKDEVATGKLMMQIEQGNTASMSISHLEMIEYCEAHRESISFSTSCFPGTRRYLTTSITKASVACAYYYEDVARLREFAEVLVSGMASLPDDRAAILLREYLMLSNATHGGGTTRIETCKRVMRAIKAFCERQPIGKLYQPKELIYVPQES